MAGTRVNGMFRASSWLAMSASRSGDLSRLMTNATTRYKDTSSPKDETLPPSTVGHAFVICQLCDSVDRVPIVRFRTANGSAGHMG